MRVNVGGGAVAFRFKVRIGNGEPVGIVRSALFCKRFGVGYFLLRIGLESGGRIIAQFDRGGVIGIRGEQTLRDFRRLVIAVIGDIETGQVDLLVVRRSGAASKSRTSARLLAPASRTVSGSRPNRHSIILRMEVWS